MVQKSYYKREKIFGKSEAGICKLNSFSRSVIKAAEPDDEDQLELAIAEMQKKIGMLHFHGNIMIHNLMSNFLVDTGLAREQGTRYLAAKKRKADDENMNWTLKILNLTVRLPPSLKGTMNQRKVVEDDDDDELLDPEVLELQAKRPKKSTKKKNEFVAKTISDQRKVVEDDDDDEILGPEDLELQAKTPKKVNKKEE
ncbi:unnamed protein product [Orchesella dallaii]|uniref:Uncharacterized protein n=1 Tax=Orchesella dallaii TaxID=48710 RepID=A0ABP1RNV9_9HEXA